MAKKKTTSHASSDPVPRPPVVVVMGHIDHGKSTLLDAIRSTDTVAKEAGGITQHIAAYEVVHTSKEGHTSRLTFLDTPGHEAFNQMRCHGAEIADLAILVVSAEDGVMPQTKEALESIQAAGIPYIVAINKTDLPSANVERTKHSLLEHEIYLEGMGGDVPFVPISAKTGAGIDELLDVVMLAADLAELRAELDAPARGVVVESHLDPKRGHTATLIVKDGTLAGGCAVVSDDTYAPVRIMEDFTGANITKAQPSAPVALVGFNKAPEAGASFFTMKNKKEAEKFIATQQNPQPEPQPQTRREQIPTVPVLLKADTRGSLAAIQHEIEKRQSDRLRVRIIGENVGPITTADVQTLSGTSEAIILGFNVTAERAATELAARNGIAIAQFSIIYELADWLDHTLQERTPVREEAVTTGSASLLKVFSTQKNLAVVGARVNDGALTVQEHVRISRRGELLGKGVIKNLQQQKSDVQTITEGEFGMQLETKVELAPGDELTAFKMVVQ